MKINGLTLDMVRRFEGCRLTAYLCPAGVPTIGYGHTATVTREDVAAGRRISLAQAQGLLAADLGQCAEAVAALCRVEPSEFELGAMVSLVYNIGVEAFRRSSVLKAHNRGDFQAAGRAFGLWNKARVAGRLQVLPGLVARRAAEAALYLTPMPTRETGPVEMPQAVEPERPMADSRIVRGGVATAGASALGLAAEAARQVADIRDSLGEWLPYVALAVALGAGLWVVWERFKQRQGGWA